MKVFEMGSNNSRSPSGSTLIYDFAVALSDLLRSPNVTVYPNNVPIGLKVKMPLGEVGVNVDTGASAVFDLSDDLRQLKYMSIINTRLHH